MNKESRSPVMVGLMPHPPVLVPEVGGGRERDAQRTVDAVQLLSREACAMHPETVIVISPHSPRVGGAYGIWQGARLKGSFSRFGAGHARVQLPNDEAFARALSARARERGLATWGIEESQLDHGATVPLYFLSQAGWKGPVAVVGLSNGLEGLQILGESIAEAAARLGRKTVVIASGDMSHRLTPDAPAGFHPRAREFDQVFLRGLRAGGLSALMTLDPELRELAAEDVVEPAIAALSSVGFETAHASVLSYEGPFGVGYCVARLHGVPCPDDRNEPESDVLLRVARQAVADELAGGKTGKIEPESDYLKAQRGVFVTIRRRSGELRGCKGCVTSNYADLIETTRAMAVATAFNDPRFDPVGADEVDDLLFEVSVLHPPEKIADPKDLDPALYGIIIADSKGRQALMLPGVEGLDTVERQIEATRRKAGIPPEVPITIQRFRTDPFKDTPSG